MTTAPSRLLPKPSTSSSRHLGVLLLGLVPSLFAFGCSRTAPIETYTIPTNIPEQLRAGNERMLAAMFPKGDEVWFFKVTGPEQAIDQINDSFREFVANIEFADQGPDLTKLPDGWRQGANKEFRFASIDVNTPEKQLDISVSKLTPQGEWDDWVKMNVNRWRGQLGLPPSEQTWAEGEEFEVASADSKGVWVDLVGQANESSSAMSPPFAGSFAAPSAGLAQDAASVTQLPADGAQLPADGAQSPADGAQLPADGGEAMTESADEPMKFDRPEGWRDGRKTSMRLASFFAGPEDAAAELTVIPAGGDLRGNVARWLGQVRGGEAPAEIVDKAMADAKQIEVDGRPAQRFFLTGADGETGDAIDATIIPLDDGISLFVKMTGPAQTVTGQSEAIASFLKSLELKL